MKFIFVQFTFFFVFLFLAVG